MNPTVQETQLYTLVASPVTTAALTFNPGKNVRNLVFSVGFIERDMMVASGVSLNRYCQCRHGSVLE